jgi:hypothetical protein
MRLPIRLAPLLLVAAAIAAGCGSDDSDEGTGEGTTGAETSAAPADQAPPPASPTGVRAKVCRDDGDETPLLRVTGVGCGKGGRIASEWNEDPSCRPAAGESRSACSVGEYRCLAATVGRGIAVSCARPQQSIAFIVPR